MVLLDGLPPFGVPGLEECFDDGLLPFGDPLALTPSPFIGDLESYSRLRFFIRSYSINSSSIGSSKLVVIPVPRLDILDLPRADFELWYSLFRYSVNDFFSSCSLSSIFFFRCLTD